MTTLGRIFSNTNHMLINIVADLPECKLKIIGEEVNNTYSATVIIELSCLKLEFKKNKSRSKNKETFLCISKRIYHNHNDNVNDNVNIHFERVYKSEVKVDKKRSTIYGEIRVSAMHLCDGDMDRMLKIEVFEYDPEGVHCLLGILLCYTFLIYIHIDIILKIYKLKRYIIFIN